MRSEGLIAGAAGAGAAILLGILLVPFRELTPSSNLAFVFLILVIAVAEYGGRVAALATAVTSSLSLNFFLTAPYRTLTIHDRNDVIAFVGLAACGLVAAAFGARRGETATALAAERAHARVLRSLARDLAQGADPGAAAERAIHAAPDAYGVRGAALRDATGRLVAASPGAVDFAPAAHEMRLEAFDAAEPIPERGVRVLLDVDAVPVGSLEVWGGGRREAMADVARLLGVLLRRNGAG